MYLWHGWTSDPMLQTTPSNFIGHSSGILGNNMHLSVQAEHACRARSHGIVLLCCVAMRNIQPILPTDMTTFSFDTCDAAYLPLTPRTPSPTERYIAGLEKQLEYTC